MSNTIVSETAAAILFLRWLKGDSPWSKVSRNTFQHQSANAESAKHHINSPREPIVCAAVTHAGLGSGVFGFDTAAPSSLIFSSRSGNCSAFNWASFCQPPNETLSQSLFGCSLHFCLLLLLSLLACQGSKSNISNFKNSTMLHLYFRKWRCFEGLQNHEKAENNPLSSFLPLHCQYSKEFGHKCWSSSGW